MAVHRTSSEITLVSSGAKTSDGQGNSVDVSRWETGVVFINVTAVSGTSPMLTITLEGSPDNSTFYDLHDETGRPVRIPPLTAVSSFAVPISGFGKYLRVAYEVDGTSPSVTFASSFIGKT